MNDFPLCKAAGLGIIEWEYHQYLSHGLMVGVKTLEENKGKIFTIKAADVEAYLSTLKNTSECVCDEINARHCPVHQEPINLDGDDPTPKGDISNLTCEFFKSDQFQYLDYKHVHIAPIAAAKIGNRILAEQLGPILNRCTVLPEIRLQEIIGRLGIKPIEKADTAEGLLKEFVSDWDNPKIPDVELKSFYERAKKLLESK